MSEEPVILITKPEKQLIEKDNLEIEINNYDNSHLYYKGFDLGTFKEIVNLRQENKILKENAENNDKVVDIVNWGNMLLKKENQQLKNNWNKLKKFLEEWKENEEYCYLASSPIDRCRKDIYGEILDKMQEIEQGSDK